jgi:hypothetical protein
LTIAFIGVGAIVPAHPGAVVPVRPAAITPSALVLRAQ